VSLRAFLSLTLTTLWQARKLRIGARIKVAATPVVFPLVAEEGRKAMRRLAAFRRMLLYSVQSGLAFRALPGRTRQIMKMKIRGSTAIHLREPARSPKYQPDTSTPMKSRGEAPALMERGRQQSGVHQGLRIFLDDLIRGMCGGESGPRRAVHRDHVSQGRSGILRV